MRAAVFMEPHRPLELREVTTPDPGPGELLIRVAGCGICHTDLHYLDHGVATFKPPPLILGHEASGTVAALGPGVDGWKEGERVLLPAVLACRRCPFCRDGRDNLCADLKMLGNNVDGAFAEYIAVPASEAFQLPEGLPLVEAAVIADAISTPYHAVKHRGRVRPGDTVAVVGCGGVGLNLIQCAKVAGGYVIAIDPNPDRLRLAERLGASATVNPREIERPDKHVKALTGGGVEIAFEAVGTPPTIASAYSLIRKGGRLCVVGYSQEDAVLSAARLMYYELEVVGSLGCRSVDYPAVIELVRAGHLQLAPIVSGRLPLEEINEGLDRLRGGQGVRWVVTP